MTRVPEDSIDYPGDGYYYVDGKLFTGVGFSNHKDGWLETETEYRDGTEWGMKRRWYAPNKLLEEAQMRAGAVHGRERIWHRNGKLEEESECEFGVTLRRKSWDEDGDLVEVYEVKETDPDFKYVQELRDIYKGEIEEEKRKGKE